MNTTKFTKTQKTLIISNTILCLTLFTLGYFIKPNLQHISNKSLIALAVFPFGIVIGSVLNLLILKRKPKSMKNIILNENDERLVLRKVTAEAMSFRVVRFMLYLFFMAYTYSNPNEIFVSAIWWILCGIVFASMFLTIIFEVVYDYKETKCD